MINSRLTFALSAFLTIIVCSCSHDPGVSIPNSRPTVRIVSGPAEGDTTHYRPRIFWDGFDSDGDVDYFEYYLSNHVNGMDVPPKPGDWIRTDLFDDVFFVAADLIADLSTYDPAVLTTIEAVRAHTFYIRAVDLEGARSTQPATRWFIARNISPVADITNPPPADSTTIPPIKTFQWIAQDSEIPDPISTRWMLIRVDAFGGTWDAALNYIRSSPNAPEWSQWRDYSQVRLYTTPDSLESGRHIFAVQVRDEAGAISEAIDATRNAHRLIVP